MKSIFVTLIMLLASMSALADQFCSGFERGYITGYMQATGSSLEPLVPLCPLQPLKRLNDPQSDFEHGYIIGLQRGLSARR